MEGIQHAFTAKGEKKIGKYHLDGYAEWESDDGLVTVGYEYYGCRWHRCPWNCGIKSVQTEEQFQEQRKRESYLNRILTSFVIIQGCQWAWQKKFLAARNEPIRSTITPFLGRNSISESEILDAIKNGTLYGLCKVDIDTPTEIAEKFKKLNFPLIFNNVEISEDQLSPETLEAAKAKGCQFPLTSKTLSWNAKGYIGCTPLLQFYMQLGMRVSNVQWALQYQPAEPFQGFVDSLVDVRINATRTKNGPLGDRAKFVLNSAVG